MGDTGGHLGWALVLLFLGPVLAFVVRRRWRNSAARAEEVQRLAFLAAAEAERAEMEAFREYSASIMREIGWVPQPPPVVYDDAPSPAMPQPVVYATAAPSPPMTEKRAVCAVCFRETTTRCARCKAVRYCSGRCQIIHWRQGHKDECCEQQIQTDNKPNGQAGAPNPSSNSSGARVDKPSTSDSSPKFEAPIPSHPSQDKVKAPPLVEPDNLSSTTNADSKVGVPDETEGDNKSGLEVSAIKVTAVPAKEPHTATVTPVVSVVSPPSRPPEEKLLANNKAKTDSPVKFGSTTPPMIPNSGSGTEKRALKSSKSLVKEVTANKMVSHRRAHSIMTESAKKVGEAFGIAMKPLDNEGGVTNGTAVSVKNFVKQHSISKITRHYPSDLMLFPYDLFLKLYNSDMTDLRPFGLANCGNSCYANTVFQCLTFTRPLTAYLLEGLHTTKCGLKTDWCFTCEFERLVLKGKQGKSSLSPANILSGLSNAGSPFGLGLGREEDAHEFMKYVIEKMQSVCIKEAGINANNRLAEETTLVQLIFGGYLRSKIRCMKCQGSSEQCERMMDLTVPIEGNITTLEEALAKFTSAEVLDGDNKYQCNRCKSYERAKKKMTILEAPNVLTIALKRYQSGKFGKVNKLVRFPEHLNLAQYMSGTDDKSPVYSLYAVVVHRDVNNAAFSGHYVCYVKDTRGKWYEINDSMVQPVSLDVVLSKCAYLLLYARCLPRAPSSVRRAMAIDPVRRKTKQTKPTNQGGSSGPNPTNQPPFYLFEDGPRYPSEYSSDNSSLFSNSDEGSSSMSTESMTSVDSTRNSTSTEEHFIGDFFFGDFDRISSGFSAGPNPQFEDSGLNPVPNMAPGSFLYTDSSGDSGVVSTGFAGHSSSRRETDWGGLSEGQGTVLSRRPSKGRSAQTFYS